MHLLMDPWPVLLPLANSGKARGLFVTSRQRTQLAPNLPTTGEVGLTNFNASKWQGVWAPKATPDTIVVRLASALAEVSKDPDFIAKTALVGNLPTARGPKDFAAFIKSEVETNTELLWMMVASGALAVMLSASSHAMGIEPPPLACFLLS